ncbi:SWIM zinc finger family protein [Streptomyces sp. PA03-1a]|nr:SWIM zinc finger family protein [Streptomyces sp. PA03-1a]MDX2813110.1 SWIM zinc finger family protein [Streptomyces sp. PA03-5A]
MSQQLPPVAPAVTAELVGALPPRLRKRLDAGVAKLAARPVVVDGDAVRIAVDDDTDLELHAPGGTVTRAEDVRCGCLLAPDCLHRAAAASAAPVAEATAPTAEGAPSQALGEAGPEPENATPQQHAAADALRAAGAAVLDAGIDGSGAVVQAELLRAAHSARLSGLPRAAAAAVSVVTRLRAARAADPGHRLADLVAALRELLGTAHRVPYATGPELAAVRGTARQPYTPDGSLRLYGLFSEPVLTASGYAGAVTWTADADGRLYTVSDVAPGGPGRATGAADRAVRIGDTALSHRELSRAGLAVSGATVSPTGRLGAGAAVRAVRAPGAAWTAEPLDRLWRVPVAEQAVRALTTGDGLLFLDVTLIGTVREAGGACLLAECDGLTLRLAAALDHPALPHRDNLRLLAGVPGTPLRVIARLDPAPHPRALLLATSHPADPEARVDTGLDRLQRADLPAVQPPVPLPLPPSAAPDEAPVHLLLRRVHQAASGGRRVLALPTNSASDARRLRRAALPTAADLLQDLDRAAADRGRDPFGRLLPADTDRFALAWLAAAVYADELSRALCAATWSADPSADPSAAAVSPAGAAGGPV